MSAQPAYQKSVEEELELTSRVGVASHESRSIGRGAGVAGLSANSETGNGKGGFHKLKTNNFFLPPSFKFLKSNRTAASNSLATSPVIFGSDAMSLYLLKISFKTVFESYEIKVTLLGI